MGHPEPYEHLEGVVERCIYQNQENGFTVFSLKGAQGQSLLATVTSVALVPGQQVRLQGSWTLHPKFGKQFTAVQCQVLMPTSVVGIMKYLGSGLIKGIGPVYARKLVDRFGVRVLDVIDQTPEQLYTVPGIGKKRVEQITQAWAEQKDISELMVFLQERGVSPLLATKIYKQYKQEAVAVLHQDPYRLAQDIWGVGFHTADTLAQHLGYEKESLKRIKAGIIFILRQQGSKGGHLYMVFEQVHTEAVTLLELSEQAHDKVKMGLNQLYQEQRIVVIEYQNNKYIGLTSVYGTETAVAARLKQLLAHHMSLPCDLQRVHDQLRVPDKQGFLLHEQQQKAVLSALSNKVTVITGGPGTGKTTIIKTVTRILEEYAVRYCLAAPTGRAAKRMQESTGKYAQTVHRLLDFDVRTMKFVHNEHNALKCSVLIVDEASMIDIFLAHAILKAVSQTTHLILLGDVDQLPSVGAGNFLNDIIASGMVPTIRLTQIFRQSDNSLIVLNAHKIQKGEFPTLYEPHARRDFLLLKAQAPEEVLAQLRTLFLQEFPRRNIPLAEAVVLVPMHKGPLGTVQLNHFLQSLLNRSTSPSFSYAGQQFKVGDRVMQIRNNYDKIVFNGDIGTIESLDLEQRTLTVRYFERLVVYEYQECAELVLAYAISVHKSQGSEYQAVIVVLTMAHYMLLQRTMVYTAITRAKKLCIVLGQPQAIACAIKNHTVQERCTLLKPLLQGDLGA